MLVGDLSVKVIRYKIGNRISKSLGKYECPKCGLPRKTLQKTERGWRCIRCVGLTEDNWVSTEPIVPLAIQLYRSIVTPSKIVEVVMLPEVKTGCDHCGKRYQINEFGEDGFPLHPKVCNDCCKVCEGCGKCRSIDSFLKNKDSQAYKDWFNTVSRQGEFPLGLLIGRDSRLNLCVSCQPFRNEPEPKSANPAPRPKPEKEERAKTLAQKLDEILAG